MIIEVKDLSFSYNNQKCIFEHLSFSLNAGQILTILGPNGAGKSTLLNCVLNLLTPTSGCVYIEGKDIRTMPLKTVARTLGYVPQIHAATFGYTVRDFVVMGRAPYLGMLQKPSLADYERTDRVIKALNLTSFAHRPYTEISGGERQQAAIARAVVQQPKIIVLDEPTNHLDYGNQLRTIQMIKQLADQGYAVIMTTHMPDHAIMLGGKVAILDHQGRLTVGPVDEIIQENLLKQIYRSDLHVLYIDQVRRKVCIAGSL